jgi:nucleotide-binding universal stress UspA family protein
MTMFKHLLVPIDGSDVTKKALKKVLDLAKKDAAIIALV